MLRILITNDDGIHAEGIRTLAAQLAGRCEIIVVAPETASSASSHCITLHKPLRINELRNFRKEVGLPEATEADSVFTAYMCSGRPADCVTLGLLEICKRHRPHLVLSGVNDGCNVAEDLSYSGTVGAALEGAVLGVPSIALSLDSDSGGNFAEAAALSDLLIAAVVYRQLFPWHLELLSQISDHAQDGAFEGGIALSRLPHATLDHYPEPGDWTAGLRQTPCLNVNIPGTEIHQMQGFAWTSGGHRTYEDVVKHANDPRGRSYYWIGGDKIMDDSDQPGTDTYALPRGYVSITPISFDLTHHHDLALLSGAGAERAGAAGSHKSHEQ